MKASDKLVFVSEQLHQLVELIQDEVELQQSMHTDSPEAWLAEGKKYLQIGLMCMRRALEPRDEF